MLQRVAADLRAVDVVFAASAMTATGDGVRLETCTLSTYAQADLGTELRITATLLFHAFAVRVLRSPNEPRIADLEPPVRCTLPCGEAVRLRRLYTAATSSRHVQRFYGEAYALPLGDAGTHAAMLQFATTDVDHAARSSVGYREVAESLAFAPADRGTN